MAKPGRLLKPFKCHEAGCYGRTNEAPGWCDECTEPTNPTVDNRIRRKQLSCSLCPPNRVENASRKAKHGPKKPKRKNRPNRV